jgi:hypothetical protein
MNETTQQWRDDGSGSGYMQTVTATPEMKAESAYRKFLHHATITCTDSCRSGVNCPEGVALYRAWRDLRAAASVARS